jgi:acetone carboxylase gamma subunit
MRKRKTIYCYLDGKKHCDVIKWALATNMYVADAKKKLIEMYPAHVVTFKTV